MKRHLRVISAMVAFAIVTPVLAATPVPSTCSIGKTVSADEDLQIFKGNIAAMKAKADPSTLPTVIIDPRTVSDYQKGHIPGAINLPVEEGQYTKDAVWKATANGTKSLMLYCNGENCPRSHMACEQSKDYGYTGTISYFYTGMGPNGWPTVNGPTVAGDKPYPDAQ